MLIDVSFFTAGSRHILNATLGTESTLVNDTILDYIATYQAEYLTGMLGAVGEDIHSYLVDLDEDASTERNEAYDSICSRLRQPFADYVFFQLLRVSNTQATIMGLLRLKEGANEYASPMNRGVITWNRMVSRNRAFLRWCEDGKCPIKGIKIQRNLLTPVNRFNL